MRSRNAIPRVAASALFAIAIASAAAQKFIPPGRYEITITQELPNVLRAGAPVLLTECLSAEAIANGSAFRVRSENPIHACALSDVQVEDDTLRYRIACPQPNAPFAKARFVRNPSGYEGTIALNMGGKNMTLTERHVARRLGDC